GVHNGEEQVLVPVIDEHVGSLGEIRACYLDDAMPIVSFAELANCGSVSNKAAVVDADSRGHPPISGLNAQAPSIPLFNILLDSNNHASLHFQEIIIANANGRYRRGFNKAVLHE